ncbi:transposase [soil metagenome]
MTDHTTMSKVSRLDVIATGARRRWSLEEKHRIVAESYAVARNVSATARRYGLSNGQLFTWRRLAREDRLVVDGVGYGLVRAIVGPEIEQKPPEGDSGKGAPARTEVLPSDRIEIVLSVPRRVSVCSGFDALTLERIIAVLEGR